MKKTTYIFVIAVIALFIGAWSLSAAAHSAYSSNVNLSAAAFESEADYTPATSYSTVADGVDYEGTAIVGIGESEPAGLPDRSPATGVEIAIIPAAIALLALVASFVIGKFIKKK